MFTVGKNGYEKNLRVGSSSFMKLFLQKKMDQEWDFYKFLWT